MKRLPFILVLLLIGIILTFNSMGKGFRKNEPSSRYDQILRLVGRMLTQYHYSPQKIDDAFSRKIFQRYLNELDPEKIYFLKQDIDTLKKFELQLDDEVRGNQPVSFFLEAGKKFDFRVQEAAQFTKELLTTPFNFNVNEEIELDGEKLNFPISKAEQRERLRKKMKFLTLERYADLLEMREKNKGVKGFEVKSDQDLEKEARERVKKLMDRTFERYRSKFTNDDKFNLYVNAVTNAMDPHTEYFPPVDKRYFDEEMSGRFYGIGASLQYDDGNIKIVSVLTGSPAWKSGEVHAGDIILKVGQGNEEPVDLTGYTITDAVKIIRGAKGTEVRLTLKKQDGTIKVVSLIRDEIVQDETFARSAIVKNGTSKIGYIYLPEFYADFERANGNRSYLDVAREITRLKEEKVEGIIMDLRNNGGGSLYDVVQMAGLFIEEGPIVQVKDKDSKPSVLRDKDRNVLYNGPLVIMVNEFSASASEIFAAAMQDYNRGVVIGSSSTYGKGTVQRNLGLDPNNAFFVSNSDLGTIKLTLQKFYRINGQSTQLKGVSPDIIIPDQLEFQKIREKDNKDALPWDEIGKTTYSVWNPGYDMKTVVEMSRRRIQNDNTFRLIKESTEWLAKQNDKKFPLELKKYQEEQKAIRNTRQQIESLIKLKDSLDINFLAGDLNRWANDKNKQERFQMWLKLLRTDIYLDQAVKVMNDIISLQNLAKARKK
ncbi:MAG: carboxy terminal-processing peptidase [Chitinophagaceae bacterium]|nr:carboxy terminal-processing peptidase [Chitinophagaceae bacterium]